MGDGTCGARISERTALERKQHESVWDKERDQIALGDMNVANESVRSAQVVCSFSRQGNVFPEHAQHVQEKESLTQRGDCAKVIPLNSSLDFDSSINVDNLQKGYVDYSVDATTRRFKTKTLAKMQRNMQQFKAFHHLKPSHNPNQLELSDNPNQLEPPDNRNQLKPPDKPNQMGPADKHLQLRVASKGVITDESNPSVYSLYMERDFRYYFQYPYLRLLVAIFVTICNFFMYAEDPVAHSCKEARVSIIGSGFAFMFGQYAPNAWSVVKVLTWLSGIITGMLVGKFLLHQLLFNKLLRFKMLTDDQGSWMLMLLSAVFCVYIFSHIYNAFLNLAGDSTVDYRISDRMAISHITFTKITTTATWCGDFFTAWLVTDMMLQERLYPMWAQKARKMWNTGNKRICIFWIVIVVSTIAVVLAVFLEELCWDDISGHSVFNTNEVSRGILASFILVLDFTIVMQDWDFPHFIGVVDLKLPGMNTPHIRFKVPRLCDQGSHHVNITGKWFTYSILFIVTLHDLTTWTTQTSYTPYNYGQYTDSEGYIYTVYDDYSLKTFNESLLTFSYRNSTISPITNRTYIELDIAMTSRYLNYPLFLKLLTVIPCLGTFITFSIFVWVYGRLPKPTKDDRYAGRLKKRKKDNFIQITWKRLRKRMRMAMEAMGRSSLESKSDPDRFEEIEEDVVKEIVVAAWQTTATASKSCKDLAVETRSKTTRLQQHHR